jgi:hypothetical protein
MARQANIVFVLFDAWWPVCARALARLCVCVGVGVCVGARPPKSESVDPDRVLSRDYPRVSVFYLTF